VGWGGAGMMIDAERRLWYPQRVETERREKIRELGAICGGRGIKKVVCDLDDTMWDIQGRFDERIAGASEVIARVSDVDVSEVERRIRMIIGGLREEMNVNPARVELAIGLVGRGCGLDVGDGVIERAEDEMLRVYGNVPQVFDGVFETIEMFREAGVGVWGVSQAQEGWTKRKIETTKMSGRLNGWVCTPVDQPKGVEQWMRAYDLLRISRGGVMVVGDDYRKDILPNLDLVNSWALVLNGKRIPEGVAGGVLVVERTGELVERMIEEWGG
jgi:hypothetical protein